MLMKLTWPVLMVLILGTLPALKADGNPCAGIDAAAPTGSWSNSCYDQGWDPQRQVFSANCRTLAGVYQNTTIDMTSCLTCDLVNIDGNLECTDLEIVIDVDFELNSTQGLSLQYSSATSCHTEDCSIEIAEGNRSLVVSVADGQEAKITFVFPKNTPFFSCGMLIGDVCCSDNPNAPFTCTLVNKQYAIVQVDGSTSEAEKQLDFKFCFVNPPGGTICGSDPTIVTKSPSNIGDGDQRDVLASSGLEALHPSAIALGARESHQTKGSRTKPHSRQN